MSEMWTDIFDRWIRGELSAEEVESLSDRTENDPEFQKAFEEFKILNAAVEADAEYEIRNEILELHAASKTRPDAGVKTLRWIYSAAVFAAIVGLATWAYFSIPPENPQLFAEYYEPYPPTTVTRSSDDRSSFWQKFNQEYSQGDFSSSLVMLGQAEIREVGPDYLIHFYSGHCLLAEGNEEALLAIDEFSQVLTSDNDFHNEARWGRVMAYLKTDQPDRALDDLEILAKAGNFRKDQVDRLLDLLR